MRSSRRETSAHRSIDPLASKRWMARRAVYEEVLDALDHIFCRQAIEYLPIKGAHLICAGIAGEMAAREMIDLDLLVRPADFNGAVAFLRKHPLFSAGLPDPWHFEQAFRYRHGNHAVRFELHRAINRPERFSIDINALFDRSNHQTAARRIMSPEDALVVLIGHTLVHLVDGIRDQVYEEAAVLIRQPGFSWDGFVPLLDATGIGRFGRALLSLAARREEIALPAPLKPPSWAVALLRFRTPRRGRGVRTALFRGAVELVFVKHPLKMARGFLRHWR